MNTPILTSSRFVVFAARREAYFAAAKSLRLRKIMISLRKVIVQKVLCLIFFMQSFEALDTYFCAVAIRKFCPLQVGVFAYRTRWIIMAAEK